MFGIIRPCQHRLTDKLKTSWMAHLCGLCLALRDDHGQLARTATNYDGLIISVLVEAQRPAAARADGRRTAGPCPLRGMRSAEVAKGEGARLAAAVSLALASVKVRDHVLDADGVFARRPVAAGARVVARRWDKQSAGSGSVVGFDTAVLLDAASRQGELERTAIPGSSVLLVTEPTETATAAAFAHTAVLAERPGNAAALSEAGRLFGRLAHLLDAAEDQEADDKAGAWNPLTATGTSRAEVERLCRDAVHGIRLALKDVELTDRALTHLLLAHETEAAVERVFGHRHGSGCATKSQGATGSHNPHQGNPYQGNPYQGAPNQGGPYQGGAYQQNPYQGGPFQDAPPPGNPYHYGGGQPPMPPQTPGKPPRGPLAGCAMWVLLACTCQLLCCEHNHPFTREPRKGFCERHDCDCCDCCDPCDCSCQGCQCCCDAESAGCCDGCDCCDCCDCN
ncbi:hypothetical protein P3T35_005743 [Kitasatospora sp. GP30]|uniref:proline-rich domain-containing protein n=1 Tax=Kitasatospora sp. GP30 TaxID=3035084 RepID=UPI000CBD5381|nr:DUF5685 family protein [Kitasatospora sp. GP30]MDH6143708.1 hypothetical protein [Kitasatospora sp. GP30]